MKRYATVCFDLEVISMILILKNYQFCHRVDFSFWDSMVDGLLIVKVLLIELTFVDYDKN